MTADEFRDHLVDELLTVDEIRGIQIVYDGLVSPPLSQALPVMQRVQESGKCLILRKYSSQDLDLVLPHLSAHRLALDVYFTASSQARQWIHSLQWRPFGD